MNKPSLAIIDARCPSSICHELEKYVKEVFLFKSDGCTYESISCHPDIFIYQDKHHLIIAPNAPSNLFETLDKHNINYQIGTSSIGYNLKDSCYYNCLSSTNMLFHKKGFTDQCIIEINKEKNFIELPQSYTRCSLLSLNDHAFITSDNGIHKVLTRNGFLSFLFDPHEIQIPVHKYGFLGGTCGIHNDNIFFLGNPLNHSDGKALCHFIETQGLEVISLGNKKLYDGGGIFFIE